MPMAGCLGMDQCLVRHSTGKPVLHSRQLRPLASRKGFSRSRGPIRVSAGSQGRLVRQVNRNIRLPASASKRCLSCESCPHMQWRALWNYRLIQRHRTVNGRRQSTKSSRAHGGMLLGRCATSCGTCFALYHWHRYTTSQTHPKTRLGARSCTGRADGWARGPAPPAVYPCSSRPAAAPARAPGRVLRPWSTILLADKPRMHHALHPG